MRKKAMGSCLLVLGLLVACGGGADPAAEAAEGSAEGGSWSGTVEKHWKETVEQSGEGMHSLTEQTYDAIVQIASVPVDVAAWELSGSANVLAEFTSEYTSHTTTPLGPCNVHYTDEAKGKDRVQVEGGLEAGDGFYQFHVNVQGFDGTNETMRDDSGCRGPNKTETTPWPVAPTTIGGSGDLSNSDHISGSSTSPDGKETITWDLTRSR